MTQRWADKYSPRSLKEVVGQGSVIKEFVEWYGSWKPGAPALLLHGGPGTGKTSLVHALASERNLDIIEINASDTRNAESIETILGGATKQQSLFRKGKVILADEIDGLAGREDRGGVGALVKIIKESKFPVVLTANDAYDPKLRALRQHIVSVRAGKVHLNSLVARLRQICQSEGVECEDDLIKHVARTAGGDMRAALTDLETLSRGRTKLEKSHVGVLGYREQEQDVFEALRIIFKTRTLSTAIRSIDRIDKDPDELFWWLEQNVANEYEDAQEIAQAFEALSRADVFRSRIRKSQNWRFRKYMIDVMCGGVALAKQGAYAKFTRYAPPQRLIAYGRTKNRRAKMASACAKLSPHLHSSSKDILRDYVPLFAVLLEKDADFKEQLLKIGLTEEEIELFA